MSIEKIVTATFYDKTLSLKYANTLLMNLA